MSKITPFIYSTMSGGDNIQVEIYADIVFLINFMMDFLILYIVKSIIGKKVKLYRIALGAFISALLYCVLIFIPEFNNYYRQVGAMFVLAFGIVGAFTPKQLSEFFKLFILCHIVAFALGGVSIGLFYFSNLTSILGNMITFKVDQYPFKLLLSTIALSFVSIELFRSFIRNRLIHRQSFAEVNVKIAQKTISFNALIDTGNTLKDPVTGSNVIIVEFKKIKRFLPEELRNIGEKFDIFEVISNAEGDFAKRLRVLPFTSLGRENGMLLGLKPDNCSIKKADREIELKDVIIGVSKTIICYDGTYNGLVSPSIFSDDVF